MGVWVWKTKQNLHYMTRIGRSTSPAGNDCLGPYFRLSCVIGWVQPYCVEGFFGYDSEAPYFGKSRVGAGLFWYYLPGGYKFNRVIAITETGCDTGYIVRYYLRHSRFMPLSCDTAGHGKGCKIVSSSFRCLAVYMILVMCGVERGL